MKWLLLVSVALSLVACDSSAVSFGATPTPTCESGLPAFAQQLDPLAREWDDANAVANSTPRSALATQISNLQSVRRRVQDLNTPACGAKMKGHLVSSMDATIDGYIAFLGQKVDTEVNAKFEAAKTEMTAYKAAIFDLQAGPAITATPQ